MVNVSISTGPLKSGISHMSQQYLRSYLQTYGDIVRTGYEETTHNGKPCVEIIPWSSRPSPILIRDELVKKMRDMRFNEIVTALKHMKYPYIDLDDQIWRISTPLQYIKKMKGSIDVS